MKRCHVTAFVIASSLGLLIAAACSGAPSSQGLDHRHATYSVNICGLDESPFAQFDGGVHTHGDGVIHFHPAQPSEAGENASLVQFFENAGGYLSVRSLQLPDDRPWRKGDVCPDGRPGRVVVVVNDGPLGKELDTYVPRDGDRILIAFVPAGSPVPPLPALRAPLID